MLTPDEAATLAALTAKAAEDESAGAETVVEVAGDVAEAVGAAVADAVADVAESVAHVVAEAVEDAHEGDAGGAAVVEAAHDAADAAAEATEAAELAAGAAVAAIMVVDELTPVEPEPLAGGVVEVVEGVTEDGTPFVADAADLVPTDDAPAEQGGTTHPWFRPRRSFWTRLRDGA